MTPKAKPPPIQRERGQRDFVTETAALCPCCGRPWVAAKRVCRKCGQPIAGGHRWRMVPVAPNLFGVEHRDCDDPKQQARPAAAKDG